MSVALGERATRSVGALLVALVAFAASAQEPARELLNSERIEREFGSYGIEVLEASESVRVSNLFSTAADARTCRTFAIVRYPTALDPAVHAEHARIVAGGSIGAVFAQSGWQVRKTHLHYDEIHATERLAALMHVSIGARLAEHVYVLDVAKAGRVIEYAALVEIHHPDYLTRDELASIYGRASATGREDLVRTLLAVAAERVAR